MNQIQAALEQLDPACDTCRELAEQYQPGLIPAARTALIGLIEDHLRWQHRKFAN